MITIHSDIAGLILQNTLKSNINQQAKSIERLTTGYRINHAKDDAAGYSIATKISVKLSSMDSITQNIETGLDLLSTASGAVENITELLQRVRTLTMEAANGTYDDASRAAMQAEADALLDEINRIVETTEYNGMTLFSEQTEDVSINSLVSQYALAELTGESTTSTVYGVTSLLNNSVSSSISNTIYTNYTDSSSIQVLSGDTAAQLSAQTTLSDTIEGAVELAAGGSTTIDIDGVAYEVTNRNSGTATLSYVKDSTTGQITFYGEYFTIKGQSDAAHDVVITGSYIYFYGGDLGDTITINGGGISNQIYGEGGDDLLTIETGVGNSLYGGEGNDTIYVNGGNNASVYGDEGDDTLYINSGSYRVEGGDGDDKFYISSNVGKYILGGEGEDEFYLYASNLTVNGGDGTNYLEDYGSNNIYTNVPNANANIYSFVSGETKTITVDGIEYAITASSAADLIVKLDDSTGAITFDSSYAGAFTIVGQSDVAHNVVLENNIGTFYGGDLDDTITTKGNNKVYAGDGNDTITSTQYHDVIYGEGGDDTITVNGFSAYVDGGDGDDSITTASSVFGNTIYGGDGDDTINISSSNTIVAGGEGNDTINASEDYVDVGDNYIKLAAGETVTVTINGVEYTVTQKSTLQSGTFYYNYNEATGEVILGGDSLTIVANTDEAQNILLYGNSIYLYLGAGDDKVVAYGYSHYVYAGDGDDTLVGNGNQMRLYGQDGNDNITINYVGSAYGGDGDDVITINGSNTYLTSSGGAGNDTYYINNSAIISDGESSDNVYYINTDSATITGTSGNETFYVSGDNNTILGSSGNNYFVVTGNNNILDGGVGYTAYTDTGIGNTFTNAENDPNSGVLYFTYLGEVKTFEIDGKTYTVTNDNDGINTLSYSYNSNTGSVILNGSTFTIDGVADEANILEIYGDNNIVNGGSMSDTITVRSGSNNIINGNDGDDILLSESSDNSLVGGGGNDTITVNVSTSMLIDGGEGDDIININTDNATNITAGSGNDKITINGSNNILDAQSGNNSISITGDSNTINAEDGNNTITINGDTNSITASNGSNSLSINGDENTADIENLQGNQYIYGNNNTVNTQTSTDRVVIRGDGNTYTSAVGDKTITITGNSNNVSSGDGDDRITITGDSNTVTDTDGANTVTITGSYNNYAGGAGTDTVMISGDNNYAHGGAEDDTFNVMSGKYNTVDGGDGNRNIARDYAENTTILNCIEPKTVGFNTSIKVDIGSDSSSFIDVGVSFSIDSLYVDLSSSETAAACLDIIDNCLAELTQASSTLGALMNRLESAYDAAEIKIMNLTSSLSVYLDADIAEESTNYLKSSILVSAGTQLFTMYNNLRRENVLALLSGIA